MTQQIQIERASHDLTVAQAHLAHVLKTGDSEMLREAVRAARLAIERIAIVAPYLDPFPPDVVRIYQ